jgi:hypothetical protein
MIFLKLFTLAFLALFIHSCTTYSTDLNELQKIKVSDLNQIKRGEACSRNIFGAFSFPYFGDTAIKISGDQSVISAIKKANITDVYATDFYNRNYFVYSKRCTVVFGK